MTPWWSLPLQLGCVWLLCAGDYIGQNEPPACSCFCPAICKALWEMTNAVWCLKDCGVWCKCSQGRGEVNYLGLNSYFVLLQGSREQTGEEGDASQTSYRSRSLWKKQSVHIFIYNFFLSKPRQDIAPPGHAGVLNGRGEGLFCLLC